VVAVRLMRMVSTDDVVFRRVSELIRVDSAFSAEVLRVANSPLLGCRQEVRGILNALAILGLERLKGLVMTVALRNFLSSTLEVPVQLRCWRHSLACALLAELVAEACWVDKDACYTAGLLHDMGRLSLLETYPGEYAGLLETVDEAQGDALSLMEYEREMFDADHCQIGRWLAEDWGLPTDLKEIIGCHHEPPAHGRLDQHTIIHVSCRLADMLGFQAAGPARLDSQDDLRREFPQCGWDRLKSDRELLLAVAGKINALECSLFAS
jgi:putative nucleotidyltransferase with HDIG domain